MKITEVLVERVSTEQLVKDGQLKKIELYASVGDGFAERLAEFLEKLASYTAMGCSREVGILDDSDAKDIKMFIDGDGSDRIRDVKLVD
jgi:hypothetical protein